MDAQIKVLIDLNVILDVLQRRQPHYEDSARLLALAESQIIEGMVAAHSWTTLFYLYTKDQSADLAHICLTDLLQFLTVATVDQNTIEQALNLPYQDSEVVVQMITAVKGDAKFLVTRNIKDYKAGPLRALRRAELLELLTN